MHISCSWQRIALALAIAVPVATSAQPKTDDPRDPSVAGPAITYHSSFSDYDAYQDVALAPWRKSNDDVRAGPQMDGMDMNAMPAAPVPGANKTMAPMPGGAMPGAGKDQKGKE